jgi:hypothetical protein
MSACGRFVTSDEHDLLHCILEKGHHGRCKASDGTYGDLLKRRWSPGTVLGCAMCGWEGVVDGKCPKCHGPSGKRAGPDLTSPDLAGLRQYPQLQAGGYAVDPGSPLGAALAAAGFDLNTTRVVLIQLRDSVASEGT